MVPLAAFYSGSCNSPESLHRRCCYPPEIPICLSELSLFRSALNLCVLLCLGSQGQRLSGGHFSPETSTAATLICSDGLLLSGSPFVALSHPVRLPLAGVQWKQLIGGGAASGVLGLKLGAALKSTRKDLSGGPHPLPGLVEAAKEILPSVEHKHVFTNYKKLYNSLEYKKLFWAASMSTTVASFEGIMEELKCINYEAYDHLMKRNLETWSRAYFPDGRAREAVENGISESFNSVIMEARTKPLLTMLEEILLYVMERFFRMADKHNTWREDICPAILKKLEEWCQDVRYLQCKFNSLSELVITLYIEIRLWIVVASETNVFKVRLGFDAYQVDLDQKFCTCRLWAVFGIPCIHACAAMNFTHHQPQDFISEWFTKKKFAETYIGNIRPLNGSNMWARAPYTKPFPPIVRRMPGRPKIRRRKHVTEEDKGGFDPQPHTGTEAWPACRHPMAVVSGGGTVVYGGWWATSATEGRESPHTNHHRHPLLVLLHLGETWRLFGVGNGHRAPAIGSSGETRGGNAGRQPASLAAKAVAGYLTLTRPIDTGNGLQRNQTHREGRILPEDCRRQLQRWLARKATGSSIKRFAPSTRSFSIARLTKPHKSVALCVTTDDALTFPDLKRFDPQPHTGTEAWPACRHPMAVVSGGGTAVYGGWWAKSATEGPKPDTQRGKNLTEGLSPAVAALAREVPATPAIVAPAPVDSPLSSIPASRDSLLSGETSAKGKEKMDADGRGKENMDASVNEEGLQDIPVIMDFTNHKHAADLLLSGYLEDTIYQALNNEELHVVVEEEPKISMVLETEEDEGVPETQSSQRVLRKLSQRSLLKKRPEKAKETEAEMVPETEEDVAESQPSQTLLRKRKKSERIVLKKLSHRIPGAVNTSGDPCSLEEG
ncbi:hypothetical protein LXL04_010676 [Taraxacum kok-saghyz]